MQHSLKNKEKIVLDAIAKVLYKLRVEQGKSQRILAFEYGIQKSLISRIESASNSPLFITVWMLAEALGIKPSVFVAMLEEELPDGFSLIEQ
ncbi:helix-turn-helix transcriptional regulator [bacterium]|nr:helix-turn-helix transcriptional regulator [bacterium]